MMPVMLVLMIAMFYFLLIRPQQRREKERQAMLSALKIGDRVIVGGGFFGVITNLKEKTCMVRLGDNVKVEVLRSAIAQVLNKDEVPSDTSDRT
jgi:preprotein translocase subunit YajC